MAQPITSDEGDAHLTWNCQAGVSMPTPYLSTVLNSYTVSQAPSAVEMEKIGVDIDTTAEMKAYYRFAVWTD